MSYRLYRALVCDSADCAAAPSVEALITADETGNLPDGWAEFPPTPENAIPLHLCPMCVAAGKMPQYPSDQ